MKIQPGNSLIDKTISQMQKFLSYYSNYGHNLYCPVCKRSARRFDIYGNPVRENARCFWCGSLERHRLTWLYFQRMTDLFSSAPKRMLHVAPEPCFVKYLEKIPSMTYLTADITDPHAMIKMDITNIHFPSNSFDVIYCCHVLEHVTDDKKAMRELYRVLKIGGWAILSVPISHSQEHTFEDPLIISPEDRFRYFGQEDHVRRYGNDYSSRLETAGFDVKVIEPSDFLNSLEIKTMAITAAAGSIFFCQKIGT